MAGRDGKAFVANAKETIVKTVTLFGPEACCLSFNGGKDSTVLLHLLRESLPEDVFRQVTYAYFRQDDEFAEITQFIEDVRSTYNIHVVTLDGTFRECLEQVLSGGKVKLIFLGTRKGDPGSSSLATLSFTDGNWPACVRVNPILDWEYVQVWTYLKGKLYCKLYDDGYTSLGSVKNTKRNPHLQALDGSFRPAHTLIDGALERQGRTGFKSTNQRALAARFGPTSVAVAAAAGVAIGLAAAWYVR